MLIYLKIRFHSTTVEYEKVSLPLHKFVEKHAKFSRRIMAFAEQVDVRLSLLERFHFSTTDAANNWNLLLLLTTEICYHENDVYFLLSLRLITDYVAQIRFMHEYVNKNEQKRRFTVSR